jgi:pheromone alpha factor receptor
MSNSPESIIVSFSVNGSLVEVPFAVLNRYCIQSIRQAIIFAVSIGTCLTMTILLWIINFRKTKTLIFWLNQSVLTVFVIRSSLYLAYLLGPLGTLSFDLTGLVARDDIHKFQVSIAANAFQVILIALIQISMNFQLYTIFKSTGIRRLGIVLSVITGMLSLTTVAFYIQANVAIGRYLNNFFLHPDHVNTPLNAKLTSIPSILFATSVLLVLIILMSKLVLAVRTRRYLGLKQFDSFQVLLVMSTQTLIVPSILTIVTYVNPKSDLVLLTLSLLLIAINLPLSSMWALAANNNPDLVSGSISFVSSNISEKTDTTLLSTTRFQKQGSRDIELGFESKLQLEREMPHDIQEILEETTSTICS